jgi:hypothetical protein
MKQHSQSIINSTKSFLGRLTKVTTVGCLLALVFLGATTAQPKTSAKARPFKATAIYTAGDPGTFQVAGNATHLGAFVGMGTYVITDGDLVNYTFFTLHVVATWTAANGDTITIDFPEWVNDNTVDPPTSTGAGNIIGGTGRFANATGSFFSDISPATTTPGVLNILTGEGTISY